MAGRTKWSDILAQRSPEMQAEVRARADEILTSFRLGELRKARGLTQEEMADLLDVRQVSVSKLEARSDVRVSTLRSVVQAMGGDLEIRARFPDAEYRIDVGEEDARVERIDPDPLAPAAGGMDTPTKARSRQR